MSPSKANPHIVGKERIDVALAACANPAVQKKGKASKKTSQSLKSFEDLVDLNRIDGLIIARVLIPKYKWFNHFKVLNSSRHLITSWTMETVKGRSSRGAASWHMDAPSNLCDKS